MDTLIAGEKLDSLLHLLRSVDHLPGAVAELGVYQGGALRAMAQVSPLRICYGFDTFKGQPAGSWRDTDYHQPGEFNNTSIHDVQSRMPSNVTLVPGVFPKSAEPINARFCFAHVDFDLEQSTVDAISWLRPRMIPGGIVVFDDWQWVFCQGVERAIKKAGLVVRDSVPFQCYWTAP